VASETVHAFFTFFSVVAHVFSSTATGNVACCSHGSRDRRARIQIAVATLSGNSLRQAVHTHRASAHQAAKLVAALLMVARVTAGLAWWRGGATVGRRTCDQEVASSIPGQGAAA